MNTESRPSDSPMEWLVGSPLLTLLKFGWFLPKERPEIDKCGGAQRDTEGLQEQGVFRAAIVNISCYSVR
jgi:hypothetical protein